MGLIGHVDSQHGRCSGRGEDKENAGFQPCMLAGDGFVARDRGLYGIVSIGREFGLHGIVTILVAGVHNVMRAAGFGPI